MKDLKKLIKLNKKFEQETKIRFNDKTVKQYAFKFRKSQDQDQALKIIDKAIDNLDVFEDKEVKVAMKFGSKWLDVSPWQSTDIEDRYYEPISIESGLESLDKISEFVVYTVNTPESSGGSSKKNMCLCNIIRDAFPLKFYTNKTLKRKAGVRLDEKIPIKSIPLLEEYLKCRINCSGDYDYTSPHHKFKEEINITLKNGHYERLSNQMTQELNIYNCSFNDLPLVVFLKISEDNFLFCDGKKVWTGKRKLSPKKFSLVEMTNKDGNLMTFHQETKKEFDELKEASDGDINLYQVGGSYKQIGLLQVYKLYQNFNMDDILPNESDFLQKAGMNGFRFHEKGTFENCYEYDINSYFPHIMSKYLMLPLDKPVFKKIDELPERIPTNSIIRCKIEAPRVAFHPNKRNYYTDIEVKFAVEQNFEITLINDGQANMMTYKNYSMFSSKMAPFIKAVYELKKDGIKGGKKVLNHLWGGLGQRNRKIKHTQKEGEIEVNKIDEVFPVENDTKNQTVHKFDPVKYYKTRFARMIPFLTAKTRVELIKQVKPEDLQHIKFINTDGILFDKKIDYLKLSNELGDWKVEKENVKVKVVNGNKKEYE